MLWWKFTKFLMSFSKLQFSFSSNLASPLSVMKEISVLFKVKHYILCTKGANQSANFWNFWVFGSKFTKFLSFLKQQISFSSNLHNFSLSWDVIPVYFFSWNFIYFQEKEPIKLQIWWNFTSTVKLLKFCTLMGAFV